MSASSVDGHHPLCAVCIALSLIQRLLTRYHPVGLDFILRDKMMKQQQSNGSTTTTAAVDDGDDARRGHRYGVGIEEVEVGSVLGRGLKTMLLLAADTHTTATATAGRTGSGSVSVNARGLVGSIGKASARTSAVPLSAAVADTSSKPLLRTVYEFDVNPFSEQDVPVVIIKSRGEARHQRYHDSYIHYSLSSEVSLQLDALYKHGKLLTIKQRKKRELKEVGNCRPNSAIPAVNATSSVIQSVGMVAMKPTSSLYDSIYDDDVVVGRYIPLGALEGDDDGGGTTALPSSSSSSSSAHPSSSAASSYISSGHPPISSIADMLSDGKGKDQKEQQWAMVQQSKEDLMKPVQVS